MASAVVHKAGESVSLHIEVAASNAPLLVDLDEDGSHEPEHGGLALSERAWPVLKGDEAFRLRRDPTPVKGGGRGRSKTSSGSSMDVVLTSAREQELFEKLRQKRLTLAREQSVPPYVIFHDRTLVEMARDRPQTLEALGEVGGVGAAKLQKYGPTFLELLRESS